VIPGSWGQCFEWLLPNRFYHNCSCIRYNGYILYVVMEPGRLIRCSDGLRAGRSGFDSRQEKESFLYSAASIEALWPTQPPIQCVPTAVSMGVRLSVCEADHSLSIAEVKKC
jgi:hypothetical protein